MLHLPERTPPPLAYLMALTAALLLGLAFEPAPARAQTAPLVADRPGFGDGASVVAPGTFQLECGYAFERDDGRTGHALGQLLGRVGINRWLEARPALNSFVVREGRRGDVSGLEDASLGLKARLVPGDGQPLGRPQLAFVADASLPTGEDGIGSTEARFTAKLAADWALSSAASLTLNAGYGSFTADDVESGQALLIGTLNGTLADADNLGVYAGYAGFFGRSDNQNYVEGGVTYLLNANTQIDANGGALVDDRTRRYFIGAGLAYRF